MQCFAHRTENSVGICKSCGKGICSLCAIELENGISCKGTCEDRVKTMNLLFENNAKIISASNAQLKSSGIFTIILGILFSLLGGLFFYQEEITGAIFLTMGVVIIFQGIFKMRKKYTFPQQKITDATK